MKKGMLLLGVLSCLVMMASVFLVPEDAQAISAWARKEGQPCSTCHIRINRLNQTGLDYLRQGFTFDVGAGKEPKAELEELGKYFSIFSMIDIFTKKKGKDYTSEINKISLFGGGSLGSNYSFYGETALNPPAAQEIADLYAQYTPGHGEQYGFIRAGQILPMLFSGENTWEFANDASAAFVRDRRVGVAAGYNYGNAWGEIAAVKPAGDSTRNKVDVVANAQYIFTPGGSSLGAYYWGGNFNRDTNADGQADVSDKFTRYGAIGQLNEITNLFLTAAYSEGKGDSSVGGEKKTRGISFLAEYLILDKASVLFNVVNNDPDTSVSNDKTTDYKVAAYYWLSKYVSVDARFVYTDLPIGNNSSVGLRARFMF